MKRREFLAQSGWMAGTIMLSRIPGVLKNPTSIQIDSDQQTASSALFETSDARQQTIYNRALDVLSRNTVNLDGYPKPVLIEGSSYKGIWLECGPLEGLAYSLIDPEAARHNHLVFFDRQREDGQLPCWSKMTGAGFGQIQMVVPIAATAWELAQQSGDSELLEKAYAACSRWDAWLRRYRDTRHMGLCEGFCVYDTGHDNSPRWKGIPNRCPDADARKCPPIASMPRLCPDLSATVYGGRLALAAMARALGKSSEADRWLADAAAIRSLLIDRLYSEEDAAFYDLDAQNHFVRIRGDVITRVLGEHVVDQRLFDTIYSRQIHSPKAFWAPYPLPSIAMDHPAFVRPIPRNSWGGASQALTALRAPRWMEHYGKPADLAYLMQQWVAAISREGRFLQQMDPLDGTFTGDLADYSPAALVFMDFTWRLAGIRNLGERLEWNVRPPAQDFHSRFRLRVKATLTAEIRYSSDAAQLFIGEKPLLRTSSVVRLVTDLDGNLKSAAGLDSKTTNVHLEHVSGRDRKFSIKPNESVTL
jgi:hypothetical protein